MAERSVFAVGFLNVVATPHPAGIYSESLAKTANTPVNFRRNDWAIITEPKQNPDDTAMHEGTVSVWTDIDSTEPSIDKATFEKKDVEEELKKIFDARGFNNRAFSYILDEKTHKIAVELQNTLGKTLSVRQAGKIFGLLFSSLNREGQTFEITVVPQEDAVRHVLALRRLDKVRIVVKRPNPGDHRGGDADEVLRELREQNMKEAEFEFTRQPGTDGIHLNEQNQTRAAVAAQNGHVDSSGVNDAGEHEKRSTKEYPKIVKRTLAAGTVFVTAVRDELRRLRGG
jgi:hypothetical protein